MGGDATYLAFEDQRQQGPNLSQRGLELPSDPQGPGAGGAADIEGVDVLSLNPPRLA